MMREELTRLLNRLYNARLFREALVENAWSARCISLVFVCQLFPQLNGFEKNSSADQV